jgi:hypothetical protein
MMQDGFGFVRCQLETHPENPVPTRDCTIRSGNGVGEFGFGFAV